MSDSVVGYYRDEVLAAAGPRALRRLALVRIIVQTGNAAPSDYCGHASYRAGLSARGHTVLSSISWTSFSAPGGVVLAADASAPPGPPWTPLVSPSDEAGSALRAWVRGGGTFVTIQAEDWCNSFSRLFDKPWRYTHYSREWHELWPSADHAWVFTPPKCPRSFSVKAIMFSGVPPHEAVASSGVLVAIACGRFGTGRVAALGDVNWEPTTQCALAALADAARVYSNPSLPSSVNRLTSTYGAANLFSANVSCTAVLVDSVPALSALLTSLEQCKDDTCTLDCEATEVVQGQARVHHATVLTVACTGLPHAVFVVHLPVVFSCSPGQLRTTLSGHPCGRRLLAWLAQTKFVSFGGLTSDALYLSAIGAEGVDFTRRDVQAEFSSLIAAGQLPLDVPGALAASVAYFFGTTMSKTEQRSHWGGPSPLSAAQVMYAANDVVYTARLWEGLLSGTLSGYKSDPVDCENGPGQPDPGAAGRLYVADLRAFVETHAWPLRRVWPQGNLPATADKLARYLLTRLPETNRLFLLPPLKERLVALTVEVLELDGAIEANQAFELLRKSIAESTPCE